MGNLYEKIDDFLFTQRVSKDWGWETRIDDNFTNEIFESKSDFWQTTREVSTETKREVK